jgi:hypothetical protein
LQTTISLIEEIGQCAPEFAAQKATKFTQNKAMPNYTQQTSTFPITINTLIMTSTNLPLPQTLAAELVGNVCRLWLVADRMLVSLLIAAGTLPLGVPFPACVLAAETASVPRPLSMPVGLAVPTKLLEFAAESFAPVPHFSFKLPIWVPVGKETMPSTFWLTLDFGAWRFGIHNYCTQDK